MESLKGRLLIAGPQLADPNFSRAVVLLLEHDENGAFGVVLNRPSHITVREVWEEVADEPCDCDRVVNVGGPVVGPLMAIHTDILHCESEIMPGIYLASSREYLNDIVREEGDFRLFSGYAGWGEGQLEGELEAGGWFTRTANAEYIFDSDEDLWHKVGKDITSDLFSALKIKRVPSDPSLN